MKLLVFGFAVVAASESNVYISKLSWCILTMVTNCTRYKKFEFQKNLTGSMVLSNRGTNENFCGFIFVSKIVPESNHLVFFRFSKVGPLKRPNKRNSLCPNKFLVTINFLRYMQRRAEPVLRQ